MLHMICLSIVNKFIELLYYISVLLGRLFFDEEEVSNSEVILRGLDDIDVESSMYVVLLCISYSIIFYLLYAFIVFCVGGSKGSTVL